MKNYRLINFRAFLIVAVSTAAAVLCACLVFINLIAGIVLFALLLTALAVALILYVLCRSRYEFKLHRVLALIIALAFSAGAFSISMVTANNWLDAESGRYTVYGRVDGLSARDGDYVVYLSNLSFYDKKADGRLRVTVNSAEFSNAVFLDYGDYISFEAYVTASPLIDKGEVNASNYRNDVRYYASVSGDDFTIYFGEPSFLEKTLSGFEGLLISNMGEKYGGIAFSIFTGDKRGVSYGVTDYFGAAGIGHIMAVSGLHIGFVTLMLGFLLKRVPKLLRFIITCAVLGAYLFIAAFSPSVLRAVIMCIVSMAAVLFRSRKDLMSGLAFAFSVILVIKPLYLFEAGFVMSFGALLGILLFSNALLRALTKIKMPYKLAKAVSSCVSVQAGITPPMIYFFHCVQPYGLIVNIFMIPFVMVLFMVTSVCALFALFPTFSPLLAFCAHGFRFMDSTARIVAALPLSKIILYSSAAIFLCYILYFIISSYFMLQRGKKYVNAVCGILCAALCFNNVFYTPFYKADVIIPVASFRSATTLTVKESNAYLIGDIKSYYDIYGAVTANRIKRIKYIIVDILDIENSDVIIKLARDYKPECVYYYQSVYDSHSFLVQRGINVKNISAEQAPDGYEPYFSIDGFCGFKDGNTLYISNSVQSYRTLTDFDIAAFDIIRAYQYWGSFSSKIFLTNYDNFRLNYAITEYVAAQSPYAFDRINLKPL